MIYGILDIENAEPITLDESDIYMLEAIAEYIGVSIERIELLEKITKKNRLLARQATELQQALQAVESQKEIIEKQNEQFLEELSKAGEFQKSLLPESFCLGQGLHPPVS